MDARLDVAEQAEMVRSGHVHPSELIEATISRIERLNPENAAVIRPLFDSARRTARGDLPGGPFRGVRSW